MPREEKRVIKKIYMKLLLLDVFAFLIGFIIGSWFRGSFKDYFTSRQEHNLHMLAALLITVIGILSLF